MDATTVKQAYSRWARVYDWVFGPLFTRARRRAIELMEVGPGDRVIEVGVGTGLSLPLFPGRCEVVGVDFSRPMLRRAAERVRRSGRGHLVEGDGAQLPFPASSFDAALAPYVVSAAPRPIELLREMRRVCRRGAPLVVLNHFSADHALVAAGERALTRLTSRLLGFHADFDLETLFERAGLEIEHRERVPPLHYWHVVRCRADGCGEPASEVRGEDGGTGGRGDGVGARGDGGGA